MIGTDSVIATFISIEICIVASGVDGTCCNFEQMQNGCSNMFQGRENELLPCTVGMDFPATDGSCQMNEHSQKDGFQDGGLPSNQIQLFATDITWDTTCQLAPDLGENCLLHQRDSTFLTLEISFTLTGANIQGIHFDLRTLEGEVEPSVGSLERSCHFLHLNKSLSDDIIGNRTFTYSGFVGLHPGSRYRLKATTLTTKGTYSAFTEKEFTVKDCIEIPENNSQTDFFCNIPTPAHWPSTILLTPNTFDVTFTVWPEEGVFDFYALYLLNGHMRNIQQNDIIVRKDLKYIKNNIEYQDVDGVYTTVMRYTFEGANEMQPGFFSIAVLPQPDNACTADYHWGKRMCLFTFFPFTYDKPASSEDTELPLTPTQMATTATVPTTSTSKVPYTPVPQYLRIIFIFVMVFLIICLVCMCLWCCNLEIYNGTSVLKYIHDCIFGENVSLDERTVTTSNWLNQYEPVPLSIPGRLHSHHSLNVSSRNSIASYSDLEM
ncbi:hypothetical protein HOLleu_05885 [Holothuria leucospilota]|uniref:Uncharacterized protein n=1 Tax=Holothuria leucospilota TaxID=206669 RepID=A0A9Q1CMA1_HOLLE|nr:hypothetical protein HOLleu_05885 [Holothuria leucospilota]